MQRDEAHNLDSESRANSEANGNLPAPSGNVVDRSLDAKRENMMEKKEDSEEKPKEKTNLGEFLKLGRYVGFVCLTYELLVVSQVCNLIYMIYGGASADVVSCDDVSFAKVTKKERCELYESMNHTDCKYEADFHSVNYEFGYVCSAARIVKHSISFQMIGIMFGAIVFGQLSDTFGRRKTLIFGSAGLIVSGAASTFATGLIPFTIARFFVMFFTGGKHSVSYVFMMENLPTKHRMWIVTVITYSPNYIVFTGIAYLCGEWRLLSRVVAAFTILPLIMLLFIYESPRWLVNKGRIDEARKAMVGIGNWDRTNTPERLANLDRVLDKERQRSSSSGDDTPRKRYYTYHLFSTAALATYTILFAYSLMTTSIISYGLVFNLEKLSGSPYLNTIIVGSLRYSINLVCAVVDVRFAWAGRRLLHGVAMSFISACLGLVFIIVVLGLHLPNLVRMTALSAAAMGSQIYILNAVAPSELFPTPIRNIGIGFIQTWNRIGNIIAPQIFVIGELWGPLPYLVMCGMSLIEVIAYEAFVPETKGKPLPERMPGEEERAKDVENSKLTNGNDEHVPLKEVTNK
uniref:Organic cation transporter protein n=1 Tax=Ascaris suum TaxID=6253 RepID=F1KYH4_ASCSU